MFGVLTSIDFFKKISPLFLFLSSVLHQESVLSRDPSAEGTLPPSECVITPALASRPLSS